MKNRVLYVVIEQSTNDISPIYVGTSEKRAKEKFKEMIKNDYGKRS